jgi:hypothetical protein
MKIYFCLDENFAATRQKFSLVLIEILPHQDRNFAA